MVCHRQKEGPYFPSWKKWLKCCRARWYAPNGRKADKSMFPRTPVAETQGGERRATTPVSSQHPPPQCPEVATQGPGHSQCNGSRTALSILSRALGEAWHQMTPLSLIMAGGTQAVMAAVAATMQTPSDLDKPLGGSIHPPRHRMIQHTCGLMMLPQIRTSVLY